MYRCLILVFVGLAISLCVAPESSAREVAAADAVALEPAVFSVEPGFALLAQGLRRGGAYLSWWKLLAIAVPFLVWVAIVDWMNKDAIRAGDFTGMKPEVWNPIFVLTLLVGFFCGISIPLFVAGYPAYLVLAFAPPAFFFLIRRSRIKSDQNVRARVIEAKTGVKVAQAIETLPQDEGKKMKFSPSGNDDQQKQVNLIRARQTAGFLELKQMLDKGLRSRANLILLDYTRDHVTARMEVDGAWHGLTPMDRATGDALLVSVKSLANLNHNERRHKQEGFFGVQTVAGKANIDVLSQGVKTGERVQLKFRRKVKKELNLNQLGMWPEMSSILESSLNSPGLVIVTSTPGNGLTATWRGTLMQADRITRDCIALVDKFDNETEIENIGVHRYDSTEGQSPHTILRHLLLAQPDFIAVPSVANAKSLDALVAEANQQERTILTRTQAKSAAEGLLRLFSASKDKKGFADAVKVVTCQRLLRRLCDNCKTEVQVAPKLIQQLGGDPAKQQTIYNPFQMPPPEQLVDEKGQPIEIKPCKTCAALGYIGRIAAYEMIQVTDRVRQVLLKNPKIDAIEQAARKDGKKTLQAQMYRLALVGVTSLAEVQRVLKSQ